GKQAVFAALQTATGANPLTVVGDVLKLMPTLEKGLPPGLHMSVVYNGTTYISAAIKEVIQTIIISALVVMIVIFLFLGAFRSMLIPMVAIPLSLVGVCFLMMVLGFSLNLMTLLAMVLAIGLVVDDAIVVLENIYRHIEEGLTPFQAAIKGAREIAGPVMVMTCTLAAVFAPIGFMGGLTGALFTEFAFTLAASVVISGMIALTFSPMVCSKVITPSLMEAPMVKRVDAVLNWLKEFYRRRLTSVLNYRPVVVMVAVVVITSCYFLFQCTKSELVPTEDQSYIGVLGVTNSNANLAQLDQNTAQVESIFNSFKEGEKFFIVDGYPAQNNVLSGLILKPWGERKTSQMDLMPLMQNKVSQVPGMQAYAYSWPMIPGVKAGPGLEVVLTSTDSHEKMYPMAQSLVQKLQESGLFMFVSSDLVFDMPELDISINRDKAANLGISMSDIANALGVLLSEANVNYFSKDGYSYQVIPQLTDQNRYNPHDLDRIHVKTASGDLIPLSALVTMKTIGTPQVLNQFNQLNSATLNAVLMPFVTTGQALQYVQNLLNQTLPPGMSYDYKDATRQYVEQGNAMLYAFIFAIIVIFLLLSAQFESFRDPFIILIAVPMSICGALIPLALGVATLNIYTQIGLITLIGLISKHGILMVEFANKLQLNEGLSIREAIEKSASIRLRPILMTTATMIFGVFPLLLSEGAGAVSRFDVGLVIASGMFIGTGFTLFVVPTMYTYFAKDHRAHHEKMKALQTMPPDMHE
ncbi:MAG: multidrug efflux protein, partial [Gammaproteobacteria bacterium]|nr:multidrug efflux protein [Gammaproteobacteria bacterium]